MVDLDIIEARNRAALAGPFAHLTDTESAKTRMALLEFFANAPVDIPALCVEVRQLREALKGLRQGFHYDGCFCESKEHIAMWEEDGPFKHSDSCVRAEAALRGH